ncbi:MAG: mannose-6-phosphate isomerase-like protein (cupin superfamily) [Alteromonadaceae bacterium]|jgi:mannose-6-phosphate isomerase-like protein (cupin superfamily)
MRKVILINTLLFTLLCSSHCFAFRDLSAISAPETFNNIHVERIGSDSKVSEFIIFIKDEVKPHYHELHTELIYVLEGKAVMTLGETKQVIKAGDFIRINPASIHSVKVFSDTPLKVLSIQSPEYNGNDQVFIKE